MGCLKLPYYQEEDLEKSAVHFFGPLDKKRGQQIFCIDYYPFGLSITGLSGRTENRVLNRFMYNGKELQTDLGLDFYDFDTRFYDPTIARFGTIDLLAADFSFQSPFIYSANNPIRYIDLYGMGPWDNIKKNLKDVWEGFKDIPFAIWDDGKEVVKNIDEAMGKAEDWLDSKKSDETADFKTDDSLGDDVGGTEIMLENKGSEKATEGSGIKGSKNTDITELPSDISVSTGTDVKSKAENAVKIVETAIKLAGGSRGKFNSSDGHVIIPNKGDVPGYTVYNSDSLFKVDYKGTTASGTVIKSDASSYPFNPATLWKRNIKVTKRN